MLNYLILAPLLFLSSFPGDPAKIIEKNPLNERYSEHTDSLVLYSFRGTLVEVPVMPARCGDDANAVALKFTVLETNYPFADEYNVIMIKSCPEALGDDFFKAGQNYSMKVVLKDPDYYLWTVYNQYTEEKLAAFWISKINSEN